MSIPDEVLHVFSSFMSIVLYDIMHYTKKIDLGPSSYFNPPHFIEVPVTSQKSERSCVGVLEVSILPLSTIYL
jgi:hypothetical protein